MAASIRMKWTSRASGDTQDAPENTHQGTITCERADSSSSTQRALLAMGAVSAFGCYMLITIDRPSLAVILAAYSSQCLLLVPYTSYRKSAIRQRAATAWRLRVGATTSSASFAAFLYNQAIIVLTTCTIVVAAWMAWTSPETPAGGLTATVLGSALFAANVSGIRQNPSVVPTAAAIMMTADGIRTWPGTRHASQIPWGDRPTVYGAHGGKLLVGTRSGKLHAVPMSYLRLGCVQLSRVIDFYTRHPELRHELTTPEGLARVPLLMDNTVEQVEQSLRSQHRK